jgi:pimeloyl-ACP methyl ester carboxylesterase
MLDGDFRYLAAQIIDDRPEYYQGIVMGHLMDNSLGISAKRESQLNAALATRWLGDINWRYKATRTVTPTEKVPESFTAFEISDIPVLMIQGDLDWSTPLKNAVELKPFLPNGHLITIVGGTHGTVRDAQRHFSDFPEHLYRFMANDFKQTSPQELYASMPNRVDLPKLNFQAPTKSFYEMYIDKGNSSDK